MVGCMSRPRLRRRLWRRPLGATVGFPSRRRGKPASIADRASGSSPASAAPMPLLHFGLWVYTDSMSHDRSNALPPAPRQLARSRPSFRERERSHRWVPIRSLRERHRGAHLRPSAGACRSTTATCASAIAATDEQIDATSNRSISSATRCSASSTAGCELIAMAHLAYHRAPTPDRPMRRPSSACRCCRTRAAAAIGSRLFDHAVLHARNRGVRHAGDPCARARTPRCSQIARNAGAQVERDGPEVAGLLEAAARHAGVAPRRSWSRPAPPRWDYRFKVQAQLLDNWIVACRSACSRRELSAGHRRSSPARTTPRARPPSPRDIAAPKRLVAFSTFAYRASWSRRRHDQRCALGHADTSLDHRAGRRGGRRASALVWSLRARRPARQAAADRVGLTARPVFSTDERRVYRQLREALPHHIVLSKLPLVRFCQPTDPQEVRYWYELLGSIHVTFAICSANGRVLAAIDLDTDRGNSRRVMQIKQAVLGACRVRYLRCPVDNLPSIAELQLLVPSSGAARGPQPAPARTVHRARDATVTAVETARARARHAVAGLDLLPGFVLRARQPAATRQAAASSARWVADAQPRRRCARGRTAEPPTERRRRRRRRRSTAATLSSTTRH